MGEGGGEARALSSACLRTVLDLDGPLADLPQLDGLVVGGQQKVRGLEGAKKQRKWGEMSAQSEEGPTRLAASSSKATYVGALEPLNLVDFLLNLQRLEVVKLGLVALKLGVEAVLGRAALLLARRVEEEEGEPLGRAQTETPGGGVGAVRCGWLAIPCECICVRACVCGRLVQLPRAPVSGMFRIAPDNALLSFL